MCEDGDTSGESCGGADSDSAAGVSSSSCDDCEHQGHGGRSCAGAGSESGSGVGSGSGVWSSYRSGNQPQSNGDGDVSSSRGKSDILFRKRTTT